MAEELDTEIIENLKRSREILGEIEEVLVTTKGEVIDGKHRLKAYPGWKTRTVQADRKTAILYRLHRNYRRTPSRKEVKKLLTELAITLKQEGVPQGDIPKEVVKLSPYSESYTLKLLPSKFKHPKKVKAAKSTFRILYPEKAERKKPAKQTPKLYTCPICGSALTLVGDLLVPYHEALKRR